MNNKADYKTFITDTWNNLKDFQRDTVMYVFEQLYKNNCNKMLVADEVGLGKTIVARGVIAKAFERFRPTKSNPVFNVIYICSNQVLAHENVKKLNFTNDSGLTEDPLNRLIYLAFKRERNKELLRFDSLTPSTSLNISKRFGSKYERAIIYSLLAHYKTFLRRKNGLKWLLIGSVSNDTWDRLTANYFNKRKEYFRADIFAKFKHILNNTFIDSTNSPLLFKHVNYREKITMWDALKGLCREINHYNYKTFPFRNETIVLLRHLLTKICLEYLNANLIILDEFQRYSEILGAKGDEKMTPAIELAQAVFELKNTKVLMLSATPFKPYTIRTEEDYGESHYEEFKRVLRFLMKRHDKAFWDDFEQSRQQFFQALRNPKAALENLPKTRKLKERLEGIYRQALVRTERLIVSEDHNAMVKSDANEPIQITKGDIDDFIILDNILRYLKDTGKFQAICPIEYTKSCPFPLSFAEGYTFKKNIDQLISEDEAFRKFLKTCKSAFVDLNRVQRYEPLGKGKMASEVPNAKLQNLLTEINETGSWRWLWLPPTINYYHPEEIFPEGSSFSKTLLFSSWVMVPRAVATVASYEAERLAIKSYYDQFKETESSLYFTDSKKRKPRPLLTFKYSNEYKKSLSLSLFTLLYPSKCLSEIYDPEQNLKENLSIEQLSKKVATKIKLKFEELKLTRLCKRGGESERWYWAAPILLDLNNSTENANLTKDYLTSLTGKTGFDNEQYGKDEEVAGKNETKHLEELAEMIVNQQSFDLGAVPNDLFDVLAIICLASPAVIFRRTLRKILEVDDKTSFICSYRYAITKNHFFNKPENIAIVRSSFYEEPVYWKAVLKYCLQGNLQSSIDEFITLLSESEKHPESLQGMISDVLSIKTVNIKVDDYNSFTQKETKMLRANYAVDFGNQDIETATGTGRILNMRQAFNSPYRPFVLATTSIGQEGLDFHYYCNKVIHWNLPNNAIDLEQREGRINRYKGLIIRKNVVAKYLKAAISESYSNNLWEQLYQKAREQEGIAKGNCELVPFWHVEAQNDLKIERVVPLYPFSRDIQKYKDLCETLTFYRLTFGQPRQEELVESFFRSELSETELAKLRDNLLIDLKP